MLGQPTLLVLLDHVRDRLSTAASPPLQAARNLIENNLAYAYLGALGPTLGDAIPVQDRSGGVLGGTGARSAWVNLWSLIFDVFAGDPDADRPGLQQVLAQLRSFLDRIQKIADDEDLDKLKDMESEIDTINEIAEDMKEIVMRIRGDGTLANLGMIPQFQSGITEQMRPGIIRERPDGSLGFPERFWTPRDFLSWRRTGAFAANLWKSADESGDDRFKAYALGWIIAYVGLTCGSAHVGSIVRSVYRNHWWRARWVANHVDAWVYGARTVSATMSGDTPSPGYDTWPSLCSAALQQLITLSGITIDPVDAMRKVVRQQALPSVLPPEFRSWWIGQFEKTYGSLAPNLPALVADDLNDAYLFTWLVLWLRTSVESLGCAEAKPEPPEDCGTAPSWADPTVVGDAGDGVGPPPPSVDKQVKEGNIICGIILAILGILLFFTPAWVAGAAAIAGAIYLFATAGTVDWDKLRCDIYWYRLYVYNGLNALHDLMTLGGFTYPYSRELALDDVVLELLQGFPIEYAGGKALLKSRTSEGDFPQWVWGAGLDWYEPPSGNVEKEATIAARGSRYPDYVLVDPSNVPAGGGVLNANGWPVAVHPATGGAPAMPGNAVDNVLEVLAHLDATLPDWNLDGDRGLAFRTWVFQDGSATNPVAIAPEP